VAMVKFAFSMWCCSSFRIPSAGAPRCLRENLGAQMRPSCSVPSRHRVILCLPKCDQSQPTDSDSEFSADEVGTSLPCRQWRPSVAPSVSGFPHLQRLLYWRQHQLRHHTHDNSSVSDYRSNGVVRRDKHCGLFGPYLQFT